MKIRSATPSFTALSRLAAGAALTVALLVAQDSASPRTLPAAQQVMDHYVTALGGHDAIYRHKSMTVHGTYQASEKSGSLPVVAYFKEGKMLYDIELPGGAHFHQGFDGAVAWQVDPKDGAAIAQGDVIKSVQRDADMYYPAHVLDYFSSMAVLGVAVFQGHACYHLKGTNKWGVVNEQFYDTTSGLLVGYRFNSAWRGGPGKEIEVFSDYKDFGGWLMPTRDTQSNAEGIQVSARTSVTYDDVADDVFALPEAVKALLAKKDGG